MGKGLGVGGGGGKDNAALTTTAVYRSGNPDVEHFVELAHVHAEPAVLVAVLARVSGRAPQVLLVIQLPIHGPGRVSLSPGRQGTLLRRLLLRVRGHTFP